MESKTKKAKLTPEEKQRRREFTSEFWRGNKRWFILTLFGIALSIASDMIITEILRSTTEAASLRSWDILIRSMWLMIPGYAMMVAGKFIDRGASNRFVERALIGYRRRAFEKVLDKSISSFSRENTSEYISALTNDITSIENNYLRSLPSMLFFVAEMLAGLTMMFIYSWKLALITLALSTIPMVSSMAVGGKLVAADKAVSERNEGFVGTVKDILSGFSVVKSFRAEREIAGNFNESSSSLESAKKHRARTQALVNMMSWIPGGLVQIGMFIVAAVLAINGEIGAGVAIAFVQLFNYVLNPIGNIPQMLANRRASLALIDKLAAACAENSARSGGEHIDDIGEGIRFENVSFGYNEGETVLHDIDLEFEAGKSYAIVGASGSGKSTLLNLLLGYRDDYEGNITVGGKELRSVDLDCLYDLVSIIQQNVFVFNSTIEKNITMFKNFPRENVESAAGRAGLRKLIAERGADYLCGENGSLLSGGEKQRISIARSLLRGAPVLLMDEATAALDARTSHMVESAILSLDDLTRIIVTHRLEEGMLERYDEVIVLNGGCVAERGTFAELMERGGYFRSLYDVSHASQSFAA